MKSIKDKIDDIDNRINSISYPIVAIAGILVIIALVVGMAEHNKGTLKNALQNITVNTEDCPIGEPFELVYKNAVKSYTVSYYRCVETDLIWYCYGDSTIIKDLHQYINSNGCTVTYEEFCKDYGLSFLRGINMSDILDNMISISKGFVMGILFAGGVMLLLKGFGFIPENSVIIDDICYRYDLHVDG